jgi:predicted negative regulator of RcsB-dependent stress response
VEFSSGEPGAAPLVFNVAEVSGQEIGAAIERIPWETCIARADDGSVRWIQNNEPEVPQVPQVPQAADVAALVKIMVGAQREILEPLGKAYTAALQALTSALSTQSAAYGDLLNLALNRIQDQSETEAEALETLRNQTQQDNEDKKPDLMSQVLEVAGPALAAMATQQSAQVPQAPAEAPRAQRKRLSMPPVKG